MNQSMPESLKSLSELSNFSEPARYILSRTILDDPEYLKAVEKGLPFFTSQEVKEYTQEEKNKEGLTYEEIERILARKGMILKAPTFKKYINLGLIPGAFGSKKIGKRKVGLYSPKVIQLINLIKYALYANLDTLTKDFKPMTAFHLLAGEEDIDIIDFASDFGQQNIKYLLNALAAHKVITKIRAKEIKAKFEHCQNMFWEYVDALHEAEDELRQIEVPWEVGFQLLHEDKKDEKQIAGENQAEEQG